MSIGSSEVPRYKKKCFYSKETIYSTTFVFFIKKLSSIW